MQSVLAVFGTLILLALMAEVLWTTMGLGGGVLTQSISSWLHRSAMAVYWRWQNRLLLVWSAILIVMTVFIVWIGLIWLGWVLIFSAGGTAVVNSSTGAPADWWERVYYVGFSIFTLGLGDFKPQGHLWQVLTALATLHGLFSVTFAITYLVPIVQAVTQLRHVALTITSLGMSGPEILLHTWNGEDCSALEQHLLNLVPTLAQVQQRHITYPILHYFHSLQRYSSLSITVTALDEAVTILECGTNDRAGLSPAHLRSIRQVLTEFLDTLDHAFIEASDEVPPLPSLAVLRQHGFSVVDDAIFAERVAHLSIRRRLLAGFIHNQGWRWEDTQEIDVDHSASEPLRQRFADP